VRTVSSARTLVVGASALAIAAATAVALSCLPDLAAIPPAPAVLVDAGPPPNPCGDGVIDIEAGEQCDPGESDAGAQCTSTCTVVCEGGLYDDASGHCYTFASPALKFDDAHSKCLGLGGHLVTFVSEDEYAKVASWYPPDGGVFWVGLSYDLSAFEYKSESDKEPGWLAPDRCPGCYAHLDAGADAFPTASPGLKVCLVAAPKSFATPWYQAQGTVAPQVFPVGVVCEREPLGAYGQPCNGGTCIVLRKTLAEKRYLYVDTPEPAASAQISCRKNGGTLVVLESREEREQLAAELVRIVPPATPSVWIGLTRADANAGWIWENDASVGGPYPLPWGDREPKLPKLARWATMDLPLGKYDTALAHAQDGGLQTLPYVCEFPR
jgi:hypothetical protein